MTIELTAHDYNSALAARLLAYANEKVDELRRSNDYPLSPEKTAELRGKIYGFKQMIDVLTPAPTE